MKPTEPRVVRLTPDTLVNYCYDGAFILSDDVNGDSNFRPCADCEWFGVWADAPKWLKKAIRAEYEGELIEVSE